MEWINIKEELPPIGEEIEFRFKDPFGGGTCQGSFIGHKKGLFEPLGEDFPIFSGTMENGRITTKDAFEWRNKIKEE